MSVDVTEATLLSSQSQLRQAVQVGTVSGGSETHPLWKSNVSDADFSEALRRSFAAHTILGGPTAPYRLDAELVKMEQPTVGFSMTVTADVRYRLVNLRNGSVVFDQTITTPFTAEFSSAFMGVVRLRLANEGAIRENIRSLMLALLDYDRRHPDALGVPTASLMLQLQQLLDG
jgi:hypothetical protein